MQHLTDVYTEIVHLLRRQQLRRPFQGILFSFGLLMSLILSGLIPARPGRADPPPQYVVSTFDSNGEGWNIDTLDTRTDPMRGPVVATGPTLYRAALGNPGGYVWTLDSDALHTFYFSAPAKYLGDRSWAYGARLSWDIAESPQKPTWVSEVILEGAGIRLVHSENIAHGASAPTWNSYSVGLTETGWITRGPKGARAPTQAEFKKVLANLTALRIRGRLADEAVALTNSNRASAGLDNVALGPVGAILPIADVLRWFDPGLQWGDGSHAEIRNGSKVDELIDGPETFAAMAQAIRNARGPNAYIYALNWWFADDFALIPGDNTSTMKVLLTQASQRGVEIRALLWKQKSIQGLIGLDGQNAREVNDINALPTGAAVLDNRTLNIGSHHQKVLIVNGDDGPVAFCGGIDINADRLVANSPGAPSGAPMHDVHCRVQGPALFDLLKTFEQRWYDQPDRPANKPFLLRSARATPNPPAALSDGTHYVQTGRTFGNGTRFVGIDEKIIGYDPFDGAPITIPKGYTFAPKGETSIREMIRHGIQQAQKSIYIEDQFLVSMDASKELLAALPHIDHLVMLISDPTIASLGGQSGYRHYLFLKPLMDWDAQHGTHKVRVFILKNPGLAHTYVHSKIWIFDDQFAIVGSANCNRRSYTHDSESDIGTCDQGDGRGLRMPQRMRIRLWAEHLGLHPLNLIDEAASADLWLPSKLPLSARVAPYIWNSPNWSMPSAVTKPAWDFAWDTFIDPEGGTQKTRILVTPLSAAIGQKLYLQAALTDVPDNQVVGGKNITFQLLEIVGGQPKRTVLGKATTNAMGVATLLYAVPESLGTGQKVIEAKFDGDDEFTNAVSTGTLNVLKSDTYVEVPYLVSVRAGNSVSLLASLRRISDSAGLAGKTITFKVDGAVIGAPVTGALSAQVKYTAPANMSPGDHKVTMEFAGDTLYNGSVSSEILVVLANTNTTVQVAAAEGNPGATVTFASSLFGPPTGASLKDKPISFSVDGATVGSGLTSTWVPNLDADGWWEARLPYSVPSSMKLGPHRLQANFAGDSTGQAAYKASIFEVYSKTTLAVADVTSYAGFTVTLTGQLSRVTPNGLVGSEKVVFSVDGVWAGEAYTGSNGLAIVKYVLPASFTPGTTHKISVSYDGDIVHGRLLYRPSTGSGVLKLMP